MILRARIVVTMDGAPIENGAVAISEDRIVDVGTFDEVKSRRDAEIVDLGEQALLPGLINAHCHLDYTCLRGKIAPQKSFAGWIRAINAEKEKLSEADYISSIADGFEECRKFGTTSVANLEAFPELISRLRSPLRTWWLAELIDVRNAGDAQAQAMVQSKVTFLKAKVSWGLAPHSPYTASPPLYRQCEKVAAREHALLTTHLAESREESSMFRDGSGPLFEFLHEIARPMSDCGQTTPIAHFLKSIEGKQDPSFTTANGKSKPEWLLAHLNEVVDDDFQLLAKSSRKFHVLHCPRSHAYFGHSPFQFDKLRDLGFNICLGTDSLASNDNLSLFEEMRAFQCRMPRVSAREIFEMVTINSALALRQEKVLGRIRPGFYADLITIPWRGRGDIFEEIIAFDEAVSWGMVNGKPRATNG